jgi:transcriptional regulator of arginine metabolism
MPPTEAITRLTALRRLLSQEKLSTQDELREELEGLKFKVTQSTISRDLRRLGAVRAIDPDGRTVYQLPNENTSAPNQNTSLENLVIDIRHNGMMIVINTTPGSASLVARHLDHGRPAGILGTIAGDDTIFVAPASVRNVASTMKAIRESFMGHVSPG